MYSKYITTHALVCSICYITLGYLGNYAYIFLG